MIHLKRSTKLLSLLLAFVLCFSPLVSVSAGAVTYPAGITKEQALSVIPKLNSLTKALMSSGEIDLEDELYSTLFSDETVNALFAEIYTALSEDTDALSTVGVDISPSALAVHLQAYPTISTKISSCKDIAAVIAASKSFKWEITSKKDFANALAAMLAPFNALLNALLCSGSVSINSLLSIKGADGYQSCVVPLLEALDCPDIMSSADFSNSALKNYRNIVKNIVNMLFSSIDALLANPVIGLCKTLPKVAYYISSGALTASIQSLLEPLSLKIAGIFTIPGISDLITSAANLEDGFDIDEMLESVDLSEMLGTQSDINLPDIDFSALAECVTDNGGTLVSDEADALIVILNYLIETLKLNKAALTSSMGESADMLTGLFNKTNDELIKAVISLFSVTSVAQNSYQWTYPAAKTSSFSYTPVFKAEDYAAFIENADPLLTDFVKESDPEGNIEDTLKKTIYSNSLISTLVKEVFSLFDDETVSGLLSVLGFNTTPAGTANTIYSVSSSTANYLYSCPNWKSVNTNYLYWGFSDGDRDGFQKALTTVLSPLVPVLSALLAGQSVTVANSVTIPGSDGYNTAIIPLLEALGCKSESIKTYSEYALGAGTNSVITDILNPICDLLDEICASPIKTACKIVPNIVYFFDSSLFDAVIENLLYPVNALLQSAGLSDMLSTAFDIDFDIDLNSMLEGLMSDSSTDIKLPEADFSVLGTLGTLTSFESKRTYNGTQSTYSYVVADSSAVFLTIMRYVTRLITAEENSSLLSGLMGTEDSGSTDGTPDMFATFAANIGDKFKDMTEDETVEWLCDLLFSSSPIKELPDENSELPTIIYEEKHELSTTQKLIIVFVVLAVLALAYYALSVTGKLDKVKLKYRKKKEQKRRTKETKRLQKKTVAPLDTPPPVQKEPSPKEKPVLTDGIAADEKTAKPEKTEETVNTPKKQKEYVEKVEPVHPSFEVHGEIQHVSVVSEKEFEKQDRRQKAAMKKVYKNQVKSQKIYEKALKQAEKKK